MPCWTLCPTVKSLRLSNYFSRALNTALSEAAVNLNADTPEDELPQLALSLALRSYANQLACARVLDIIRERSQLEDKKHKADKEKE